MTPPTDSLAHWQHQLQGDAIASKNHDFATYTFVAALQCHDDWVFCWTCWVNIGWNDKGKKKWNKEGKFLDPKMHLQHLKMISREGGEYSGQWSTEATVRPCIRTRRVDHMCVGQTMRHHVSLTCIYFCGAFLMHISLLFSTLVNLWRHMQHLSLY